MFSPIFEASVKIYKQSIRTQHRRRELVRLYQQYFQNRIYFWSLLYYDNLYSSRLSMPKEEARFTIILITDLHFKVLFDILIFDLKGVCIFHTPFFLECRLLATPRCRILQARLTRRLSFPSTTQSFLMEVLHETETVVDCFSVSFL